MPSSIGTESAPLDPCLDCPPCQTAGTLPPGSFRKSRQLGTVDEIVRRSQGTLQIVPLGDRWWVAGVIADHFPLDRESPLPRPVRQAGHWIRIVLLDRPLTNADQSAILTLGEPSVSGIVAVCVTTAVVAPWLPRWLRRAAGAAVVVWAFRDQNARKVLATGRLLRDAAPGAVVVSDFVALEPGAASTWMLDALDAVGRVTPYAVLLPGRADERRNAARERLYVSRFGLRVAARTEVCGDTLTLLVRDSAG